MKRPAVLATLFLASLLAAPLAADDYLASVEAWRTRRLDGLTRADGWLALIGRHPLEVGIWSVGTDPTNAIRLAAGPARLGTVTRTGDNTITFALADDVDASIDGTTARTAPLVYGGTGKPTYVRSGTINFYILESSGQFFLRVRDSEAPRRKNFAGIAIWPVDPAWRIEADWVPFDPPRQLPITNIVGLTQDAACPGKAVFTHEGRTYELLPLQETPESRLFFILTDTTAGEETYGAGRFLYADPPRDGKVVLDFNQVYNPPCAFSPFTTCPLPPKENVLPFALRAGEKKYRGDSH
ncbi:hypothetical protein Verru16b_00283 [Lacunisphaera limnophila]|uniref:DUF1684 domain-containing protein n=1 Tax=Lacunisphaera limnophila TaxID=1838286 RepID=A0A1I7PHZ0_9BACT|nr:DUF1684 domain-containing protein [Lacunisphaera limnophila]AOS43240.1 hypothetical protein Verru16b_00283 [Lacunisphaera limnophila]